MCQPGIHIDAINASLLTRIVLIGVRIPARIPIIRSLCRRRIIASLLLIIVASLLLIWWLGWIGLLMCTARWAFESCPLLKNIVNNVEVEPEQNGRTDQHHHDEPQEAHIRLGERVEKTILWIQQCMREKKANRQEDQCPDNLVPFKDGATGVVSKGQHLKEAGLQRDEENGQAKVCSSTKDRSNYF